jgi:hypothetical protein
MVAGMTAEDVVENCRRVRLRSTGHCWNSAETGRSNSAGVSEEFRTASASKIDPSRATSR